MELSENFRFLTSLSLGEIQDLCEKNPKKAEEYSRKAVEMLNSSYVTNEGSIETLKLKAWCLVSGKDVEDINSIEGKINFSAVDNNIKKEFLERKLTLADPKSKDYEQLCSQAVFSAIFNNNIALIKTLSPMILLGIKDEDGWTPLHAAIFSLPPSVEIIEALLEAKASVNAPDGEGFTPLHAAVMAHLRVENFPTLRVVNLLLSAGADVNAKGLNDLTPLHLTALIHPSSIEVIQLLLKNKALMNAQDKEGNTPLHQAILANPFSIEIIKVFLSKGADPDRMNHSGMSCTACANTEDRFILFHDNYENELYITLLFSAILNKNLDSIQILSQCTDAFMVAKNERGERPLQVALYAIPPSIHVVKLLLEKKPSLHVKDKHGNTPLHTAIEMRACPEIIKVLLEKKPPLYSKDQYGRTPLHLAITADYNLQVLKLLLDHGAELNEKDSEGRTPLLLASTPPCNLEVLKLLLDCGADLNEKDSEGRTPVLLASTSPGNLEVLKLLFEYGANVNDKDKDGFTPLHRVVENSLNFESLKLLLDRGADASAVNLDGVSCYLLAAIQGQEALLPSKNPAVERELVSRFKLANSWGIAHATKLNDNFINLISGAKKESGEKFNVELFEKFIAHSKLPLQEFYITYVKSLENAKEDPRSIQDKFKAGESFVFSTGWDKHMITVIFHGDYMIVVNRGDQREESSLKTYKIDRNKPLTEAAILSMQNISLTSEEGKKFFYQTLPQMLGSEPSQRDLIVDLINRECKQKDQKIDNCWWVSPKAGMFGFLVLSRLSEIEQSGVDKKDLEALYSQELSLDQSLYKQFSEFSRIQLLKEYIESPLDKDIPKDYALIKKILDKLESKVWRQIFKNEAGGPSGSLPPLFNKSKMIASINKFLAAESNSEMG